MSPFTVPSSESSIIVYNGKHDQHFVAETPEGKVVDATGAIEWEEFEELPRQCSTENSVPLLIPIAD